MFNRMPSQDVVTRSAILGGCAMHGHACLRKLLNILNRCVKVYRKMMLLFLSSVSL